MSHEPKREPIIQSPTTSNASASVGAFTMWRSVPCACRTCKAKRAGRRAIRKYAKALKRLA